MLSLSQHHLNLFAVALFLLANLMIARRYSQPATTLQDYAASNSSIGGGVLAMTLFAMLASVGDLDLGPSTAQCTYSTLFRLLFTLSSLLLIVWLPKLAAFSECTTAADVMGRLYGAWGYHTTLVTATLFSFGAVVGQLRALGALSKLFGMPEPLLLVLLGSLITCYVWWKGSQTTIATGGLQLVCLALGLGALAFTTYQLFGGGPFAESHPIWAVQLPSVPFIRRFLNFFFWALWPVFLITPPMVQRGLSTSNSKTIHQLAYLYILFRVAIVLALISAKYLLLVQGSGRETTSLAQIVEVVAKYQGVQALLAMGLCALLLSTIDVYLHALAVLWTRDYELHHPEESQERRIYYAQTSAAIWGTVCTAGALCLLRCNLLEPIAAAISLLSILLTPFVAGVAGLKKSPNAFKACLVGFCASFLLLYPIFRWKASHTLLALLGSPPTENSSVLFLLLAWAISLLIGTLAFFIGYYIEHRRLGGADRSREAKRS